MQNPVKRLIDERFPILGKAYRQARVYKRLAQGFQKQKTMGFQFLGNEAMQSGKFEPDEIEIIQELLPRADRFIDVGANIGYYSCISRQLGKPVVAFEPLESNLLLLYANLKQNGWLDTEVWPVGLADYVGMAPIFGSDTGASLIEGWAQQANVLAAAICINTIDNVIGARFADERLMLKIDVEGLEFSVLQGATATFDRPRKPIVLIEISLLEHHPEPNKHYQATFEYFWKRGYRVLTADKDRREVTTAEMDVWIKSAKCNWGVHNWLAIPPDWQSL